MAQRYCTNCGNELGPNDAFCASCGRPAHETAAVATPEADVGVPPPQTQQAGGTPSFAPTTTTPPRRRRVWVGLLAGCGGLFALLVLFVGCLAVLGSAGGGGGGGQAGSGGGSGGSGRTFTNENYAGLFSDPDAHQGAQVDVTGQLLERPEIADGELAFQMFVDIENVDWNTIVYTDQTDLELNTDDYVQVRGEVLGSLDGENAFGGTVTAPTVQASDVSPVSAGQAIDPATEVREVGQTLGDQGFDVTLEKIEFGEESTRAYVTLANNTGRGASFFTFDTNIVQGSSQIDYLEDSYAYYDEEPQDTLRPGVKTQGVLAFEPVNADQPFELRIPWTSDNYNVTSRPVVFQVSP